ncbi:uncharacterized protein BCR38DRAFT_487121 [Pseudomassariella vexata]|uniref:Rhodopsin domain-containing protein n=1 Tax=Pseudomassariella vexata TaxID=1141098 RepID=A0A1Y2DQ04_9PEZI|nr:uncharacterized protein BCR38DRAFT_487121 [Pseudomassariella vexata]ORY61371.1 hypothetical protein BCR38DRAFT_487121 [Pseudomassariella vexata]
MAHDPRYTLNPWVWILTLLATAALCLRLWCRKFRHRGLWWDDYIFVVSWALLFSASAVFTADLNAGMGRLDYEKQDVHILFRTCFDLNTLCSALSKTAFAVTLLRLVEASWQKRMIWFIIVTISLLNVANAIVWWASVCGRPRSLAALPGHCLSQAAFGLLSTACGAYGALIDFILALLPWGYVWKLRTYRRERLAISVAMSLGVVAGVTAIARIAYSVAMESSGTDYEISAGRIEYSYQTCVIFVFLQAEPAVTIIAATIPVIRVLVRDAISAPDDEWEDTTMQGLKETSGNASGLLSAATRDVEEMGSFHVPKSAP